MARKGSEQVKHDYPVSIRKCEAAGVQFWLAALIMPVSRDLGLALQVMCIGRRHELGRSAGTPPWGRGARPTQRYAMNGGPVGPSWRRHDRRRDAEQQQRHGDGLQNDFPVGGRPASARDVFGRDGTPNKPSQLRQNTASTQRGARTAPPAPATIRIKSWRVWHADRVSQAASSARDRG